MISEEDYWTAKITVQNYEQLLDRTELKVLRLLNSKYKRDTKYSVCLDMVKHYEASKKSTKKGRKDPTV